MDMQTILDRLGACSAAREWVGGRTLAQAWAECERPEWMLWLHARSDSADAAGCSALADKWTEESKASAAAAAWGSAAAAARAWESAARQCNDIRAALCLPVFNTPGEGGKEEARNDR